MKDIQQIIRNTLITEAKSVEELTNSLDFTVLEESVQALGDCTGRVIVSGCGTSGAAAKKIAHSLCCIEIPASFLSPADAVHGALGRLQRGDVIILISKGGATGEILSMIPACKTKGVKIISVTENPLSPLANHADIQITVQVDSEPCPFNMLATGSTLAVIATFDAICIALMEYTNYSKDAFAVIHPGGAVGERLLQGDIV